MISETTINGRLAVIKVDKQGHTLYFDREDADLAEKARSWIHASQRAGDGTKTWYAVAKIDGQNKQLHRVIAKRMGFKGIVDHINGNGLNNCRWNIRETTRRKSNQNRGPVARANARGGCPYKGVSPVDGAPGRWRAVIAHRPPGKKNLRLSLGCWPDMTLAALAYNEAAIALQDSPRLNPVGSDFSKLGEPRGVRRRSLERIPELRAALPP